MSDQSDRQAESSARGEAAWKQVREAVAARNEKARQAGRQERQAYERQRNEARRVAEARAQARLVKKRRTP
jgi:hypothetical protein